MNSDNIKKSLRLLKSSDVSGYKIANDTKLTEASISNWRNGKSKPTEANAAILINYFEGQVSTPIKNYDYKGAPYYNVDFIGGFDLVLADQTINPEYYISIEPYNKTGVMWCNLYGKSMEPHIFSGDKIALVERNVSDVIFGKVYGVITHAGLRTVKWVVRSAEKQCYRLVPENKDPKFGDYQDLPIKDIFKIFEILGAVRAF